MAAVSRAPKDTGIDEIKGLDDDELDYNDDVGNEDAGHNPVQAPEPPQDEKPQDSGKASDEQCCPSGDGSAKHPGGSHSDHKKSRGRSRSRSESRSPCGSRNPPPPGNRVHSGNRVCSGDRVHDGDRSRDKDYRSDHGSYYPYHPNYDRYHDDRFYDFDGRYYGWGYNRRFDGSGPYWSLSCRSTPPPRSDDCYSVDLRDMHPWGDPGFRDR